MTTLLMMCGHAANAQDEEGFPVCAICMGLDTGATVVNLDPPDLEGRTAKCGHCGKEAPSSLSLPFFDYQGPGSRLDYKFCARCRYPERAHILKQMGERGMSQNICLGFVPGESGARETDNYYCGCRGWD